MGLVVIANFLHIFFSEKCFLLLSNDQVLLFEECDLEGQGITNRIRMFPV